MSAVQSIAELRAAATASSDREIILSEVYDAPRELVWEAYTRPEHVVNWWGPDGFTITIYEMEVRPGGRWRFMMHGPDGTDYPNRIVYQEVARPGRLVFHHGVDEDDDPDRFHVTVTFDDEGGKTRLTSRILFATAAQRDHTVGFGAVELGKQHFANLAGYLRTM